MCGVMCGVFLDVRIPIRQRQAKNEGILRGSDRPAAHQAGAFQMADEAVQLPAVEFFFRDTLPAFLPAPFRKGLPGDADRLANGAARVIHALPQGQNVQGHGRERETV